jgi:ferritin-like protein
MSDYHEPYELLDPETRDIHRAVTSVKEELEAVSWYSQRIALCQDPQLKDVLIHNRDEEIEHACMGLEWLRRKMPEWDEAMRTFLFQEGPIRHDEPANGTAPVPGPGAGAARGRGRDLGIGSLRGGSSPAKEG